MASPITLHLDFASPYSWFALDAADRIAAGHGREIVWNPVPNWAVLKAQGIHPPLASPVRTAYLMADMVRSAAFLGVPYRHPERIPVSSVLPARLYHTIAETDVAAARVFGRAVFEAYMLHGRDISEETVVREVAESLGHDGAFVSEGMTGADAKARLFAAVDRAAADGAIGAPFFVLDGEGFFGVDRLPQLEWRLKTAS